MSFDIFGNNLTPGCCEVHPHHAEPYPCSLCMAELAAAKEKDPRTQEDPRGEPAFLLNLLDQAQAQETKLRDALKQSLRQWKSYAESDCESDLDNDETVEGIEYRKCRDV